MPLHGIYPAPLSCQSAYLPYATIIRRVRPWRRAYSRGIISYALSCRCDELCLFEALHPAPLARPFSKGLHARIISHRLSYRCDELCLFEAFYPAPLARPFSKGLLAGDYFTWTFIPLQRIVPLRGLYPAPLARPFSKGLLAGDYLICAFMPLRRIVPLRGTPSCAFGAALLQGPTRGGLSHMDFYTAAASCASSRHSILRLWRGPSPRAYAREEYSSPWSPVTLSSSVSATV